MILVEEPQHQTIKELVEEIRSIALQHLKEQKAKYEAMKTNTPTWLLSFSLEFRKLHSDLQSSYKFQSQINRVWNFFEIKNRPSCIKLYVPRDFVSHCFEIKSKKISTKSPF